MSNSRPAAAPRNDPSPRGPARSTTPGRCRNTTQAAGGGGPAGPGLPPHAASVAAATPSARSRNQRTDNQPTLRPLRPTARADGGWGLRLNTGSLLATECSDARRRSDERAAGYGAAEHDDRG